MNQRITKKLLKKYFPVSKKDTLLSLCVLTGAIILSMIISHMIEENEPIPTVFVLAVLIVSRLTDGYFYGTITSLISVFCVNLLFTYPDLRFNFSLPGYPLIFTTLLSISIIISTLTTRVKYQNEQRVIFEREKMRANLLRAVSHDIRTPLTSIVGATNAILDDNGSMSEDNKSKLLIDIRDNGYWLIRLVENLLSITRVGGGSTKIKKQEEMLEEPLESAVSKFKKNFDGINVHAVVPDEVVLIPMDAILIEQVILNLLQNSAIHGEIVTDIEINVKYKKNKAVVSIGDNGVGISEEKLSTLFDGYIDGQKAVSDSNNFGIGLSVCKTIINAHGGDLRGMNKADGGAIFEFTLPLSEVKKR